MKKETSKEKRRYIGTKDGQQVFCTWRLIDGVYSARVEYWSKSGHDIDGWGALWDDLRKDFPDDDFVNEFVAVSEKWDGNDCVLGSPAQMDAVRKIEPKYTQYVQEQAALLQAVNTALTSLRCKIKLAYGKDKVSLWMVQAIKDIQARSDYIIARKKDAWYSLFFNGKISPVSLHHKEFMLLRQYVKVVGRRVQENLPPLESWYAFMTRELEILGLYRDASYMKDGKAYKFGSERLTNKIPPDIISIIEGWEEKLPESTTPIQEYCQKFDITVIKKAKRAEYADIFDVKVSVGEKFEWFSYTLGHAHKGVVDKELFASAILSDAKVGSSGIEWALEVLTEMGFTNPRETYLAAKACVSSYQKLVNLGIWDQELAEEL
jgi:hypothetical protein